MLEAGTFISKFNLSHCEEILRPGRYFSRKRQVDRCSKPVPHDDIFHGVKQRFQQLLNQPINRTSIGAVIVYFPKIV